LVRKDLEKLLLASYNTKEFKSRMRVRKETPLLIKANTNIRGNIPLESRIMIGIYRMTSNSIAMHVADSYKVALSIWHSIFDDFVSIICATLKSQYIRWPSIQRMKNILAKVHGVLYVVGAIDGFHISIIALTSHLADYYNHKDFYIELL
jgi:hypothetical protein